jgi:CTP:molybdopterin cytidylyltransferase MocA
MDQATVRANRDLWIIILAAGASVRLGTPKQLLRVQGRTLLARTVALAESIARARVVVVAGAESLRIRSHLRRNAPHVRVTYNRRWKAGMGNSLAAGVRALPNDAGAILVMLCDQPNIDIRCLARLLDRARARRSAVVASRYRGRYGVPAILPRPLFPALRRLTGDRGARDLLNGAGGRIDVVGVDMPEAAVDIDTPGDLAKLSRRSNRPVGDTSGD